MLKKCTNLYNVGGEYGDGDRRGQTKLNKGCKHSSPDVFALIIKTDQNSIALYT